MSENNDQLRQRIEELIPINELSANLQNKLLERAKILDVKKSRFLFKQGDKDDYSYYLLDGEVELHQNKQLNSVIEAASDRAKYALAQLQPRQFSVKAKTPIKVLLIERNQLDQLMLLAQESTLNPATDSGGTVIEVDEVDGVDDDTDWMTSMLQSELFSRIPTANIHQLFALLEEVEFNKGDVVIKQGDPGEHYYIISSGRCAVSRKPSPQAKDVKLADLKVGDSFGEEALISDSTRNATVTMTTDGVLMQLAKDTFIELVKNPALQSLEYDEADALVNEGSAKWLDVRFPNEHKESSIEDSINIPLNSLRLQSDKLDSSTIYILYCDTGNRSSTGTFLLAERGFDVTYLDGGLMNNPEAIGVQTVVPKEPEAKPEPAPATAKQEAVKEEAKPAEKAKEESFDPEATVELLNAELETTQIRMAKTKEAEAEAEADEAKKKEIEENKRKLEEEKKQLEAKKKAAEAEAKKKAAEEELKLKKLKEQADAEMKAEQKKLEEIYNKNAEEMAKLQKAKEAAEEKIRKEREELEKQAEEARKQIEEAKRLKQEAEEATKKQLAEVEAEKKRLEEEAKKKQLEDEEREKKLQAEAKARIEQERKKLAEQVERNSKEFEQLQKEKAAAEAARAAAKQEAAKMIEEYKTSHDKEREEEQAKIKAERQKLEEEAKLIQQQMKQIQQAKLEAEKIKQEALDHASALKEKQMDSTSSQAQRDKLEVEIKAAEEKAVEAEREIEDAEHKAKLTESAQQENQADLDKKKQQEEALSAQIAGDLEHFEEKQEEEAASITQVQMQADMMKRIKMKAAEAKKNAAKANKSLLDDISKQLGND